MKLPIKERAFTTVMIVLSTIVVMVLAALQYRWSNQVSEATSIRLADSLQMSMINWHLDLFRDFSEVCIAMRAVPEPEQQDDWNQYARRFSEWKKTTAHPELVSRIYIISFDSGSDSGILQLNSEKRAFVPAPFPSELGELKRQLRAAPTGTEAKNGSKDASFPSARDSDQEFTDRFYLGGPLAGWQFQARIPALIRPIARDKSAVPKPNNPDMHSADWIVIALDKNTVREQIFPELAKRYFRGTDGLDYQVSVVAGRGTENLLYSSDPPFGAEEVADADGTMNIFGHLQDQPTGSPIHIFHAPSENKGPAASVGITWFPLLNDQNDNRDWRLIVRHRRGGALGAFVADSRRRDLAISFGVLFLLVISIAILIITSTRAQRLAKLQMDFVAAVSHELRTPLTVISSAAENIAHGVVSGKEQLEQYGTVIGGQARKLFAMVEQILLFSAIREGYQRFALRPANVNEIIDAALSSTAGLVQAAGFHIDRDIESNLPKVLADVSALSQSMQNLITNALKYGSEQRWIGIRVRLVENGATGREIQISISDRGIGIDAQELSHIFEPFYRSSTVMAAQIHGTGLGLPLAKSIVEAMKGKLSVKSSPGRGSTFTLHLPCLEHYMQQTNETRNEAVPS